MRQIAVIAAVAAAAMMFSAAPASADDGIPPSCEEVPIFGLNPHIRTICDTKIYDNGSWDRVRILRYLESTRSSCGGRYYQGGNCPPWLQRDVVPEQLIKDVYVVTPDTIPPGEPGHLG